MPLFGDKDPMPSNMRESAGGFLRGLITLQINTIEKPGMTGEPVPRLPHALLDIAYSYLDHLQGQAGLGLAGPAPAQTSAAPPPAVALLEGRLPQDQDWEALTGEALLGPRSSGETQRFIGDVRLTPALFHVLREAAKRASDDAAAAGADSSVLRRIVGNSDWIKAILKRPPAKAAWGASGPKSRPKGVSGPTRAELVENPDLMPPWGKVSADDALVVRHAWETGVEVIRAQTVVQLSGDIVTRLHPDAKDALRDMHRLGIGTSLGHWHTLIGLAMALAGQAIQVFASPSADGGSKS